MQLKHDPLCTQKRRWKWSSVLSGLLIVVALLLFSQRSDGVMTEEERVLEIAQAVEVLAASQEFWPGFDPLSIPLAIFGGENTYLLRHPTPPDGFTPFNKAGHEIYIYPGRHSSVIANSSADIAGQVSATLLADGQNADLPAQRLAAISLHEAFHVYQRDHHPGWTGDEGVLFSYPVDDSALLVLRRLETEALRRALTQPGQSGCWAERALQYRRQRFEEMDISFSAYERGTELNEGLAAYIQHKANGQPSIDFPDKVFKATEVRQRLYVVGTALALLLDQFSPGWARTLEQQDDGILDELLGAALAKKYEPTTGSCGFSPAEMAETKRLAQVDTEQIASNRKRQRDALDKMKGWRVVILVNVAKPLWPQGFDPLNIDILEDGLLHKRWLRLGNESGQLVAIDVGETDISVLTRRAGEHALFNGVRWVMVVGLSTPDLNTEGGGVKLSAQGLKLHFSDATAQVEGQNITVTLH